MAILTYFIILYSLIYSHIYSPIYSSIYGVYYYNSPFVFIFKLTLCITSVYVFVTFTWMVMSILCYKELKNLKEYIVKKCDIHYHVLNTLGYYNFDTVKEKAYFVKLLNFELYLYILNHKNSKTTQYNMLNTKKNTCKMFRIFNFKQNNGVINQFNDYLCLTTYSENIFYELYEYLNNNNKMTDDMSIQELNTFIKQSKLYGHFEQFLTCELGRTIVLSEFTHNFDFDKFTEKLSSYEMCYLKKYLSQAHLMCFNFLRCF